MDQQSEHLSSAQIEDYGVQNSGLEPDGDIEVEKHLADCPSCRSRVLEFHCRRLGLIAAGRGEAAGPTRQDPSGDQGPEFGELRASPTVKLTTTPDCLSKEDLLTLAAGLSPEAVASQWMQHVTACDRCATLLRTYVKDFSDDFSPEESAVLGQLKSAAPDWQRQAARETLQTREPGPAPPGWFFFWKWAVIPAAAACVVVVLVFWYSRPPTPEKVEVLLAQAQTEQRTIEMRWPGAQWSDFSGTMGSDHSSTPRSLMEADEALSKVPVTELRQDKWMRARAEKEIAAGNPSAAVTILESAARSASASVELRLDLAMAYFVEGKQTHDSHLYESSREVLDKILQQEPGNTVALFNLALVLQQLNVLDQSKKYWMIFLKTETDAGWRNEGKEHLNKVQELLPK